MLYAPTYLSSYLFFKQNPPTGGPFLSGKILHTIAGETGVKREEFLERDYKDCAVNKDENAPIFGVADYDITGDFYDVVPKLIEEVKKAVAR